MGMFDTIYYEGVAFQTKDFKCSMDTFEIRRNQLFERDYTDLYDDEGYLNENPQEFTLQAAYKNMDNVCMYTRKGGAMMYVNFDSCRGVITNEKYTMHTGSFKDLLSFNKNILIAESAFSSEGACTTFSKAAFFDLINQLKDK